MEANSQVKFYEAQIAMSREWVAGDDLTTQKQVVVVIPQEDSLVPADKKKKEQDTVKVDIPVDTEAARQTVKRFENGAVGVRSDDKVSDTVSQHMLADKSSLFDEAWLGTEEEELNAYDNILYFTSFINSFPFSFFLQICFRTSLYPFEVDDRR